MSSIQEKMGFKAEDVVGENNPFKGSSKIHVVGSRGSQIKTTSVKVFPDKGHVAPSSAITTTISSMRNELEELKKEVGKLEEYLALLEELAKGE